ncbi:MAG: hypothetical protein V1743_01655 [Nanoarchaeota archaeon]
MIVGAFTYLSVIGKVGADQVISVVMVVLAFYFTLKDRGENFIIRFFKFFMLAIGALLLPFFLGLLKTVPFISSFSVLGRFSLVELITVIAASFPIFIIGGFFNSPRLAGKITRFIIYAWIIGITLFYFYSVSNQLPVMAPLVETSGAWGTIKEIWVTNWQKFTYTINITKPVIIGGLNNSINKLFDPYFVAEVEDSKSDKQLGVYLQNLEPATDPVLPDEPKIVVYAELKGKTFVGEVAIKNTCYGKYDVATADSKTSSRLITGKVDPPVISLSDYEEQSLVCEIDHRQMRAGQETIGEDVEVIFNSSFNFVTWGYVTYAFMEQNELRNRRKSGEDVAKELGISETVKAVYTNGPVTLGLVRQQDPPKQPVGISAEEPYIPFLIGITIENTKQYSGRGTIQKINTMVFRVPKPLRLDPASCYPEQYSSETDAGAYTNYTFKDIPVRQDLGYQTTRCRPNITSNDIPELLGEGGIAFVTFAIEVDYEYQLSESTRVRLEKPVPEQLPEPT